MLEDSQNYQKTPAQETQTNHQPDSNSIDIELKSIESPLEQLCVSLIEERQLMKKAIRILSKAILDYDWQLRLTTAEGNELKKTLEKLQQS